jgi:hypothetical protein
MKKLPKRTDSQKVVLVYLGGPWQNRPSLKMPDDSLAQAMR